MTVWPWNKVVDDIPSYNESLPFHSFLDMHASHVVGMRALISWYKDYPCKTMMDKLEQCSMLYTVLVYENSKEVWVKNEDINIRKMYPTDAERGHQKRCA